MSPANLNALVFKKKIYFNLADKKVLRLTKLQAMFPYITLSKAGKLGDPGWLSLKVLVLVTQVIFRI